MSDEDRNPYAPPSAFREADEEEKQRRPLAPDAATKGQRVAGALLIANALLVFIEGAVTIGQPTTPAATPGASVMPALIDLGIGASLVSGSGKTARWAVIRVGLGLLLWGGIQLAQGEYAMVALQSLVSAALLLLLLGDAGRARIAAGATAFGLYAIVSLLGIAVLVGGSNPLAAVMGTLRSDIEATPAKVVTGVAAPYSYAVPNDRWYLRKTEAAKKDNALVDRWLTRPDKDAHVIVIVEDLPPGSTLPIDAYADAVLEGAKKASANIAVLERHPLAGHLDNGMFLHTTGTIGAIDLEYYYALIADHDHAYQIIAFSMKSGFASLASEMQAMIASFKLPPRAPEVP
jgi:hypothetical protein